MILEITSCENPYICLWERNKPVQKDSPPSFIFLKKKKVKFDEIVDVLEFEVTPHETMEENSTPSIDKIDAAWLLSKCNDSTSADEIHRFALDSSGFNRNSVAYNHSRRVLLHYHSYRDMGERNTALRTVSRRFSKESAMYARQKARHIADEVEASWTKATTARKLFGMSGSNARIADYYVDSILDLIASPICLSCGSLQ